MKERLAKAQSIRRQASEEKEAARQAALLEEAKEYEYWIILQGVNKLKSGNLSAIHAIHKGKLPSAIQEFRPVLNPTFLVSKTEAPGGLPALEATPNYDNNPL
ncbi:MAG: hypothetical protein HC878_00175 [Leptolyngbyaceae cyanobacterium SL_5_14]|nr:hypothetical protein [Leptolyngbyaceae cyanobacterium SL_5_14]